MRPESPGEIEAAFQELVDVIGAFEEDKHRDRNVRLAVNLVKAMETKRESPKRLPGLTTFLVFVWLTGACVTFWGLDTDPYRRSLTLALALAWPATLFVLFVGDAFCTLDLSCAGLVVSASVFLNAALSPDGLSAYVAEVPDAWKMLRCLAAHPSTWTMQGVCEI